LRCQVEELKFSYNLKHFEAYILGWTGFDFFSNPDLVGYTIPNPAGNRAWARAEFHRNNVDITNGLAANKRQCIPDPGKKTQQS